MRRDTCPERTRDETRKRLETLAHDCGLVPEYLLAIAEDDDRARAYSNALGLLHGRILAGDDNRRMRRAMNAINYALDPDVRRAMCSADVPDLADRLRASVGLRVIEGGVE